MSKKMLIDATHAEETRVVVVDGNKVEEFDFESENKRPLAGNIYLAKVTRVEPSLQAAFVDYGGNRHGFLAFSEIHPDYYQIPVADREALLEEERAYAEAMAAEEEDREKKKAARGRRSRTRSRSRAASAASDDAVLTAEAEARGPGAAEENGDQTGDGTGEERIRAPEGMEVIDLDPEFDDEGFSPMERVGETPVEEPQNGAETAEAEAEAEATAETNGSQQLASGEAGKAGAGDLPETSDEAGSDAGADAPASPVTAAGEAGEAGDGAGDEAAQTSLPAAEAAAGTGETAEPTGTQTADAGSGETGDAPGEDDEAQDDSDEEHRDHGIEDVADEDVSEEIRPLRKPRPKKYKIQEVVKVRQILLVQVVKEERGNKGAALTTYLSLAGRYCVLMPNTARGGGISRKITNAADRKKLKTIADGIDVPKGAGLIVRTAGAKRTKAEIKRDYEYLQRLWEEIRTLTLKSIAPAKIYEEGDLIKRSIRDLYSREIDEVLVEGHRGYRTAKDFMKMIMPSHAKNVKQYQDALPLFARYQVESYLSSMFNPVVQLKSGGYIVIGVTEALVAIDVNSGRATKEGSIEETALKTNLEAAEEVARQLRLRDLAGLIVIDFIDMEERKNNTAVEKRMKDKLKTDRARIQVGRISGFGLMEMSRQRLRPGMLEATTQPCPHCHGTGLVRSDDNLALNILRQLEEEGTRRRSREVLLKAPVGIVNYLINHKREHIAQIELRYGMGIRLEADPFLISPDFSIEKFRTATRSVPEAAPVVSVDAMLMEEAGEAPEDEAVEGAETEAPETPEAEGGDEQPKKKRRRRRRKPRGRAGASGEDEAGADAGETGEGSAEDPAGPADDAVVAGPAEAEDEAEAEAGSGEEAAEGKPKRTRRSRARRRKSSGETAAEAPEDAGTEEAPETRSEGASGAQAEASEAPLPVAEKTDSAPEDGAPERAEEAGEALAGRSEEALAEDSDDRSPGGNEPAEQAGQSPAEAPEETAEAVMDEAPEGASDEAADEASAGATAAETAAVPEEGVAEEPGEAVATEDTPEEPPKPKKTGWWSR
ncbi:MAG: ribonuclease [Rhodobacterales bacterium]|nr:MAG: ribonuclease [Rhodobacterales bacterium]